LIDDDHTTPTGLSGYLRARAISHLYLVGLATDYCVAWSALDAVGDEPCCHNGKVIGGPEVQKIVLPYDFDQSGIIYTEYSRPPAQLPIRDVRQRYYRGFCTMNDAAEQAIADILGKRGELEGVLAGSGARVSARTDALEYLQQSLEIFADGETRSEQLMEECRG